MDLTILDPAWLIARVKRWLDRLLRSARSLLRRDVRGSANPEIARLARLYPDAPRVWLEFAAGAAFAESAPENLGSRPGRAEGASGTDWPKRSRGARLEFVKSETFAPAPVRKAAKRGRLRWIDPRESEPCGERPERTGVAGQAVRPSPNFEYIAETPATREGGFAPPAERTPPTRSGKRAFAEPRDATASVSPSAAADLVGIREKERPASIGEPDPIFRERSPAPGPVTGERANFAPATKAERPPPDSSLPAGSSGEAERALTEGARLGRWQTKEPARPAWHDVPRGDLWPTLPDAEPDSTEVARSDWFDEDRFAHLARIQERR